MMLASLANTGSPVSVQHRVSNTQTITEDGERKRTANSDLCLLFVPNVLDTCTFTQKHTHSHTYTPQSQKNCYDYIGSQPNFEGKFKQ